MAILRLDNMTVHADAENKPNAINATLTSKAKTFMNEQGFNLRDSKVSQTKKHLHTRAFQQYSSIAWVLLRFLPLSLNRITTRDYRPAQ